MPILDFMRENEANTHSNNQSSSNGRQSSNSELPKAQVWLNFGYMTDEGDVINAPNGVAIDTMRHLEVKGQNQDWIDKAIASNDFIDQLTALGMSFEPGEAKQIHIVATLQRVSAPVDVKRRPRKFGLNAASLLVHQDDEQDAAE